MKFKLDENLGRRGAQTLREAGHDVTTVVEQKMAGTIDSLLIDICHKENRCLVSMDLDFANPLRFKPSNYSGIAVLRLPARPNADDILDCVRTLVSALSGRSIAGKLWIVAKGVVREHASLDDDATFNK